MATGSKWTWEKTIAVVLVYGIMGSLVLWGFGWSALKALATAHAQGFGIGVLTLVLLAVIAVPVILVSGMLASRRTKRLP
jgi:hypothetical protein